MTDKQDPIAHAARLLREAAEELRQSHTLSGDRNNWIGEPDAKAAYDEHLAAAQALEDWEAAVGAGGVSGPLMGIAALSANAGGPVAWLESEPSTKDWPVRNLFFGFTSFAYSSRLHMGEKPKGADQSQNRFTPLYAAPPTAQAEGWISVDERLPEPGMPVLLDIGKKYPIRAMWAAKHTVQAADDDTDWGEYVEADDMYYAPEGWYEWNQCEDNHWRVTETPRAWMPLPPTSAEGVEHG